MRRLCLLVRISHFQYFIFAIESIIVYIVSACSICTLSHVEASSNTSTVALRVVGGNDKGSLESETVKYGHESRWTRTRE
jgi:hypothetical protein